jgi:hypothetical protein
MRCGRGGEGDAPLHAVPCTPAGCGTGRGRGFGRGAGRGCSPAAAALPPPCHRPAVPPPHSPAPLPHSCGPAACRGRRPAQAAAARRCGRPCRPASPAELAAASLHAAPCGCRCPAAGNCGSGERGGSPTCSWYAAVLLTPSPHSIIMCSRPDIYASPPGAAAAAGRWRRHGQEERGLLRSLVGRRPGGRAGPTPNLAHHRLCYCRCGRLAAPLPLPLLAAGGCGRRRRWRHRSTHSHVKIFCDFSAFTLDFPHATTYNIYVVFDYTRPLLREP